MDTPIKVLSGDLSLRSLALNLDGFHIHAHDLSSDAVKHRIVFNFSEGPEDHGTKSQPVHSKTFLLTAGVHEGGASETKPRQRPLTCQNVA